MLKPMVLDKKFRHDSSKKVLSHLPCVFITTTVYLFQRLIKHLLIRGFLVASFFFQKLRAKVVKSISRTFFNWDVKQILITKFLFMIKNVCMYTVQPLGQRDVPTKPAKDFVPFCKKS